MAVLPLTNIINVTITNTPSGISEKNVNSLVIFSNDPTTSLDPYGIYVSPSQVATDYGTTSRTAKMANAIFAQTPNIRSGNGRLVVVPLQASVSAVAGDFSTADISANLSDLLLVDDGDLRVIINGVNYDLTNLDFTNADDFEDIATILQGRLVDATVTAITDGIQITSKKVGAGSTVELAAVPSGTGTALNGSGYFNGAGGTETEGTDSSGETILDAIARTEGSVGYVGVLTTLDLEDDAIEAISDGIQAQDRLFHYAGASTQDIAGIGTTISTAGNTKTRFKVFTQGLEEAALMNAAYAGRLHSVNFNGSETSQTMNLKQLATITPDLGISQSLYSAAELAGVDLYVSYEGVPSVYSTGGNDFSDNPYSDLALKFALETAGFNFLRQTNTKVPQTEKGMNGLKNAYSQICERFIRNGVIAAGTWNSSETFGNPEVFKNNISTRGYYTYSLPITQQSAVEREERKAPLVQIAIKRSGALQTSDVLVLIND